MNNIKFYDERITDEDAVNAAKAAPYTPILSSWKSSMTLSSASAG